MSNDFLTSRELIEHLVQLDDSLPVVIRRHNSSIPLTQDDINVEDLGIGNPDEPKKLVIVLG